MCNLQFDRQVPAMRRFAMTQLIQVLEFARPAVKRPESTRSDNSGRLWSCGDVGMKLIASMWTIPIALCLLGPAFADELTTSGDAKSLGFSAARLARIAPWYQARFDSFPPSDGLVPGAVVAIAKDGKLAYLQAIGFQAAVLILPFRAFRDATV
jgi:hypothetical protein